MKKLVYIIPLLVTVMVIGIMTIMTTATTNAFASHSSDPIAPVRVTDCTMEKIIHSAKNCLRCVEIHTTMHSLKDVCQ